MGSAYSFTNAFTIEAYDDPTPYVNIPANGLIASQSPQTNEPAKTVTTAQAKNTNAIGIEKKGKDYTIIHKCAVCGFQKPNKAVKEDNFQMIIQISAEHTK